MLTPHHTLACRDNKRAPTAVLSVAQPPGMLQKSCKAALGILHRVQTIANESGVDWKHDVSQDANGVAKVPRNTHALPTQVRAFKTLRQIQLEVARLNDPSTDSFRWLAMTMVNSRIDTRKSLRNMLTSVPTDFYVFHFDAISTFDPAFAPYLASSWYNTSQIVQRGFRMGSGCQVEAYRAVLAWVLFGTQMKYSHLWLLDIDMDFRLFSFTAFRALVAFRRPFLCQPAMLAMKRGGRATDRWSLSSAFSIQQPAGRERLQDVESTFPIDDVDNQPLIDALLFPAFYEALVSTDSRNQWAQAAVLNSIAREFGRAAGPWPPMIQVDGAGLPPKWAAGMVFDWTPLIHRNTKLLGWGPSALKLRNGTRCPRFGNRRAFGRWEHVAQPALAMLRRSRPRENAVACAE